MNDELAEFAGQQGESELSRTQSQVPEYRRHLRQTLQQTALVIMRTLIGWHFLYEGYYKLLLPGWSADGKPLPLWSAAGYLNAATGPLARLFRWLVDAGWIGWLDWTVKLGLLLIGLSLLLGLFTKAGCWGALFLLSLFYLLAIPFNGTPQPGNEGTYLIVNKTLIEAAAVSVLLTFDTGAIAGLDLWRRGHNPARKEA